MSNWSQGSHGSGNSANTGRLSNSKVRCSCGNDAVVRTVRNGVDVGKQFYGCPKWPVSCFSHFLVLIAVFSIF